MSYKTQEPVVQATSLGKRYELYARPIDRLKQIVLGKRQTLFKEIWALRNVNLSVYPGEVLGIVGKNGAGKSTLLQLLCGTLPPTTGQLKTNGRVAALLELGAGFNPEFSGRDNIYLNASILGLDRRQIDERYDEIVSFSGLDPVFIEQPVKTYSSGMYVRLAFAIATSVEPDILVVDEALSVGDGDFSRRSFDKIMSFKDQGKTILFCSHALYQVEAICNQAIWLHQGQVQAQGSPPDVVAQYADFLAREASLSVRPAPGLKTQGIAASDPAAPAPPANDLGPALPRVRKVEVQAGNEGLIRSGKDDLRVTVGVTCPPGYAAPSVGVVVVDEGLKNICSAGSHIDGVSLNTAVEPGSLMTGQHTGAGAQAGAGAGAMATTLVWPKLSLLKGKYHIDIYLLCERGIHVYEHIRQAGSFQVSQDHLEVGVVSLSHYWRSGGHGSGHEA